jgi:membrane protease YdiL (CAAX protease family)
VLGIAGATTVGVTALSHLVAPDWAGSAVGVAFLWLSYALVARNAEAERISAFGLSFGGLFEPEPIDWRRVVRESGRAMLVAFAVALVVFPPFLLGFIGWWKPTVDFHAATWRPLLEDIPGQLLMVALPEEAFYRGYLQTSLDKHFKARLRFLGGHLSWGVVISSAIFAVGHLLTEPNPSRLAVFFPSLLFGWLRTRTGGVGSSVVFHALCNLYSAYLGRSFGLYR